MDDSIQLTPTGAKSPAREPVPWRDLREWLGDGEKRITPGEASVAEKLRYWSGDAT